MSDAEQDYEQLKARWQREHSNPHAAHHVVLPPDTAPPRLASEAKGTAIIALVLWLATAAAAVSHLNGNPTAINAVIGSGIGALAVSLAALGLWRQDRQLHHRTPRQRGQGRTPDAE
ncbi:hypothetical protein [Streptomyces sp. bgisy153]|uniref:hypothetical protein n=1 Tax=Streptomyces sp. bgisy153 TaxID=3413793 RepID=UPI003D76607E